MQILRIIAALLFLAASTPQAFGGETSDAFSSLRRLAGSWKIEHPKSAREKELRILFQVIAADSVVVETFVRNKSQPTQTMYHRDGSRLIATHYCAQGNQPRLQLSRQSTPQQLEFEYLDATNLESNSQSHLIHLSFDLSDAQHVRREEVYSGDGQTDTTAYSLVRTK